MRQLSDNTKGIFYLILSAFFFALMSALVKLAGHIHVVQKSFFRNSVAFIIAFFYLLKERKEKGADAVKIPQGSLKWLILRSCGGTIGIFGNFYAIDHLVLSDASILNKMSPFFAIVFSLIILREKIKKLKQQIKHLDGQMEFISYVQNHGMLPIPSECERKKKTYVQSISELRKMKNQKREEKEK